MKTSLWILIFSMFLLASCAQTPFDPTKPEMSVKEGDNLPPRTFNQFHNAWDY